MKGTYSTFYLYQHYGIFFSCASVETLTYVGHTPGEAAVKPDNAACDRQEKPGTWKLEAHVASWRRESFRLTRSASFWVSALGTNLIRFFQLGSSAKIPVEYWGVASRRSITTRVPTFSWLSLGLRSNATWWPETKLRLLFANPILYLTLPSSVRESTKIPISETFFEQCHLNLWFDFNSNDQQDPLLTFEYNRTFL